MIRGYRRKKIFLIFFDKKLDPAQYCTGPSLSWNAVLHETGVELPLLVKVLELE